MSVERAFLDVEKETRTGNVLRSEDDNAVCRNLGCYCRPGRAETRLSVRSATEKSEHSS